MINDYEQGLLLKSKATIFKDYKWEWFKTKEPLISAKSAQSYKSILNNHFVELDYKKIADIKKTDIQRLINTLIDKPNTENKIYMTLNQILENAVDNNIINKNPCRRIVKPKMETKKQKAIELNIDFNPIGFTPYILRHTYATFFYSGVRLKDAEYYMGHSDSKMLSQVYIHLDKKQLRENNIIENFVQNKLKNNRKDMLKRLLSNE